MSRVLAIYESIKLLGWRNERERVKQSFRNFRLLSLKDEDFSTYEGITNFHDGNRVRG